MPLAAGMAVSGDAGDPTASGGGFAVLAFLGVDAGQVIEGGEQALRIWAIESFANG